MFNRQYFLPAGLGANASSSVRKSICVISESVATVAEVFTVSLKYALVGS
jgi:hypothetical protein